MNPSVSRLKTAFAVTGIALFACWAMIGPLLTALPRLSATSWWLWPGLRALFVVGSGLWCGLGIGLLVDARKLVLTLGAGGLGALLSLNPLLDLATGPIQGTLLGATTQSYRGLNYSGAGQRISGTVTLVDSNGHSIELSPIGAQANRMETLLRDCPEGRVVALRHLDVVLSTSCDEPSQWNRDR